MPSVQQPLSRPSSIEEHVIAAFDMVQHLVNGQEVHRLILRFVYIHLVQVIEAYKATATKDRVEGQVSREAGQRDISVAINMYLKAKEKMSQEKFSRQKLLDYSRRGKRWSCLAGPSPISVFLFPRAADTIVYVLPPPPPLLPRRDLLYQKAEQFHHGPDDSVACSSHLAR